MIKRLMVLVVPLIFLCLTEGTSQSYQNAIGARLGYPLSASYKMFLSDGAAAEALLGFNNRFTSGSSFSVGLFYELHKPIEVEGLQWYYGAGATASFWSYREFSSTIIGLHGIIGLSYTFSNTPLEISLDWAPGIFLGGGDCFGCGGFGGSYGALAGRYILNR